MTAAEKRARLILLQVSIERWKAFDRTWTGWRALVAEHQARRPLHALTLVDSPRYQHAGLA